MTKYILYIFIISSFLLSPYPISKAFAQNNRDKTEFLENTESSEEIFAREQFIYERRAGGPGKIIPEDVYPNAIMQKMLLPKDRSMPNSITSTTNWISVNPIGMFYARTGSNYVSGRTNSITFHPTNPDIIYIGAAQGGVWKTTNGGVNWIPLTDTLSSLSCGDVVIDPNNPNVLYLGTGELNYSLDSHYGDGIFKSTNAGAAWIKIATTSIGSYFSKLLVDPSNSNVVYASGSAGLYKSTNAGINWSQSLSSANVNCLIMDPTNSQILFAASGSYYTTGNVFKTTNAGQNWNQLPNGLPANAGRIQLAIAPGNSSVLYASIAILNGGSLLGLYRTTDAGNTWTLQSNSLNYLGGQGWYDNSITVKPGSPNFVFVGGIDVYNSTDGGVSLTPKSSWSTTNPSNFSHADIHYLVYNGATLYCCSDGGVYKSTDDGTTWSDLNHDLSTLQYQSADYDVTNLQMMYGGNQDNDKETTTNGGSNWIQRTTGDGGYTVVDPVNANYIYGQYVGGSLQRSVNYGFSYTEIRPSGSTGGLFYNSYEMAPGDHNTIVFGRADIWETNSAQTATTGSGWTQIATTGVVGGNVSAIGISSTNTNKIYIGTSNGRILVTTDNGNSWSVQSGFPYVTDFAVDNTNDAICYATFGGTSGIHISKTMNSGANWISITGGLPNIAANSVIVRTTAPRMIFVGGDLGVFQSTDEGTTWVSFNSGLPTMQVYDLKYKQVAGILLAATHGRGCWTFNVNSIIGIGRNTSGVPKEFHLAQNFPNPFNPSTTIKYQIPVNSFVSLKIYNVLGEEVSLLVYEKQNAGSYEINWDAGSYPSGVYFYKLETIDPLRGDQTSFIATRKMVLVK